MILSAEHVRLIRAGRKTGTKMTPLMREALVAADEAGPAGLRRPFDGTPGAPPWPAHPATLRALVGSGLLLYEQARNRDRQRLDRWTITDTGREALRPREIVRHHRPLYLAAAGGQVRYRKLANGRWAVDKEADGVGDYTTDPTRSIDNDRVPGTRRTVALEVLVGPGELDAFARAAAERQRSQLHRIGARLDTLTIAQRIDLLAATATRRQVDISTDVRLIRFMVARGRDHHALNKLIALESQLNHRVAA